jgi:hypothetical protein
VTTAKFRTPGYDGPEGTEWPRRQRPHAYCPIKEPHLQHGMSTSGYPGQTCGGIPLMPEPRECHRCHGTGYIEVYVFGMREKYCTGEDDMGDCDGGMKVFR